MGIVKGQYITTDQWTYQWRQDTVTLRWSESLFVCLLTVTWVPTMQHTPRTLKVPMNVAQSPDLLQGSSCRLSSGQDVGP